MHWPFSKKKPMKAAEASLPAGRALPTAVPWTVEDVLELRKFLLHPTGLKLLERGRAMQFDRAVANSRDVFHTQHSAGVTVGISDTLNWIESLASDQLYQNLSRPSGDQDGNPNTASGEQDDAALVEKFSP